MNLKFIPASAHGMIDYLTAATLPVLPRVFGWGKRAEHVHDAIAATVGLQNMMTDQPVGVVKLIPMQKHLLADKVVGGLLLSGAAFCPAVNRAERTCMALSGLGLLALAICTQDEPHQGSQPAFAGQSPMKEYADQRRPEGAAPSGPGIMAPVGSAMG